MGFFSHIKGKNRARGPARARPVRYNQEKRKPFPGAQEGTNMAKRVIMVGIDGCHQATLYGLIDSGEAAFFRQLADNGARVAQACTMFPATTVPCCSTLYTGCWFRTHGVLNNEWVDRFASPPQPRSYIAGLHYALASMDRKLFGMPSVFLPEAGTGGSVNNDLQAPTIYEELTRAGKTSYTYFHYVGRGATRWVRPYRPDMLRFGLCEQYNKPFQIYEKQMVTRAIQEIQKFGMPDVLSLYFGCNDGHSHRFGVEGQAEYQRDFIDPELARLDAFLKQHCPDDDIYYCITADHGQITFPEDQKHKCMWADDFYEPLRQAGYTALDECRSDKDIEPLDAVVALGHGAGAQIYLKNPDAGAWSAQPDFEKHVVPALNNFLKANVQAAPFADWTRPGYLDFLLTRRTFDEPYRIYINEPPFQGVGRLIELEAFFEGKTDYIKPVERLRGIDHPKNADIVVMLNYKDWFNINEPENWHPGQHGALLPQDSIVPMIFSGPGIAHKQIPEAFTINFAPTVASILGVTMPAADGKPLDIFS
jgi:hypothetical protein